MPDLDSLIQHLKYKLMGQGYVFKRATDAESLKRLIMQIKPWDCGLDLIRVGGQADGGYIVPNDFEGLSACFSPGVSDSAFFEEDLANRFFIPSHLADFSVEGPPTGFHPKSFLKKFVGSRDTDELITLQSWMESCSTIGPSDEFVLQMDIEGSEYETLLATPSKFLNHFRILVLEIHGYGNWSDPAYFQIVESFFEKILQNFTIVHAHANNCSGTVTISGVEFPNDFEISLIRNDRIKSQVGYARLPNPLDRPNIQSKKEILISDYFVC